MISYKKINLLDLTITTDNLINNKNDLLEIKSPIIMYNMSGNKISLCINRYSDAHNLFYNLCGYIDRLFKIKEISTDIIIEDKIFIHTDDSSKYYDENGKVTLKSNFKKEGKIICSFVCDNGKFILKQCLTLK